MPKRITASPILRNGKAYGVGDPIELPNDVADQLELSGSIEPQEKKAIRPSVKDTVALIKAAETLAELDSLLGDDTRDGVIKAAEAKRAELTPPAE